MLVLDSGGVTGLAERSQQAAALIVALRILSSAGKAHGKIFK